MANLFENATPQSVRETAIAFLDSETKIYRALRDSAQSQRTVDHYQGLIDGLDRARAMLNGAITTDMFNKRMQFAKVMEIAGGAA